MPQALPPLPERCGALQVRPGNVRVGRVCHHSGSPARRGAGGRFPAVWAVGENATVPETVQRLPTRRPRRASADWFERAHGVTPGRGELPGPRVQRRRRHPAVHGVRAGCLAARRRRQRVRRPGLLLGAAAARPRAPRGRRPPSSRRWPAARRTAPRRGPRSSSPRRSSRRTPVEQVRLVSSGTEATMSAIRLARGFTGRDLVVKFAGCYHGHVDSLLAEAGSGLATARRRRPARPGVPGRRRRRRRPSCCPTTTAPRSRRRSPSTATRSPA